MTKRAIKQLIIASVFLLIIFLISLLVYYLTRPEPSCFDNIKNQEEEEIDCGGPCLSCELVNIESLKVLWAKAVSSKEGFYDLAAQIKNPNQNYGSGNVDYTFKLIDSKDNVIAEYSGTTFILPNQTKYLIETKIKSDSSIYRVDIEFVNVNWEKPVNSYSPEFAIKQKEYRLLEDESLGFSQSKAVLVNETNFDFEKIDIDVLLFDSLRNLIAVNSTEIRTLSTNQERDFTVTWFDEINGRVSFMEIEPETNIFDIDNYIPTGTNGIEEFQEY